MGILLVQILQWILRIILFLLLLVIGLLIVVLVVPIRYQVEGEFLEKKPGGRGKITWFFYLIYVSFAYEKDFRLQARVFGLNVFDSANSTQKKEKKDKKVKKKSAETVDAEGVDENTVGQIVAEKEEKKEETFCSQENEKSETIIADATENSLKAKSEKAVLSENVPKEDSEAEEDELADWEKEMEAEGKEENESVSQELQQDTANTEETAAQKEKKSFSEKIKDIKLKVQGILQKIKDIISKIQEGKLKAEHYLELWNRKETQITFSRAKTKLGRMIKALLPRKWKLTGEIGLKDPCTTGQLMGALGAMYPILGNRVQIVPDFEAEVINIEGSVKGHIRLGNLLYQIVSLVLNRHCFKFIKMIFDELGNSKKSPSEAAK